MLIRTRILSCLVGLSLFVAFGCEKKQEKSADKEKKAQEKTEKENEEKEKSKKAEAQDEEEKADDEGGDDGLSCKAVATNTVNVMLDALGDKSMVKKEHIPTLASGCEETDALEKNSETVKCMNDADSQESLGNCEGANKLMKSWMTKGSE